ncbi:MAG: amino acid kinase [Candidatus Hydrothermarchaeota archaeon]|nr:amino acid kinase [Candidatus Hydrothermarchaeota archaeon]
MYVVKLGGSLIKYAGSIMAELKNYDALIIPGGGIFADTVRKVYRKFNLSEMAAHRMAIAAMEQYGMFLSDISGVKTANSVNKIKTPCIFLPYGLKKTFKPSWSVTSDTIACCIARKVGAEKFILLKDVDGIRIDGRLVSQISAGELSGYGRTCVDEELPKYLGRYKMDCWIINGKKPDRIKKAMKGKCKGTLILGKHHV